jgi:hypothetical protein
MAAQEVQTQGLREIRKVGKEMSQRKESEKPGTNPRPIKGLLCFPIFLSLCFLGTVTDVGEVLESRAGREALAEGHRARPVKSMVWDSHGET